MSGRALDLQEGDASLGLAVGDRESRGAELIEHEFFQDGLGRDVDAHRREGGQPAARNRRKVRKVGFLLISTSAGAVDHVPSRFRPADSLTIVFASI